MVQGELLSREELDALLASVVESGAGEGAVPPFRETPSARLAAVSRIVAEYAEEHARSLSALHQRSIEVVPMGLQELTLREFAGSLLPVDRVVVGQLRPGGHGIHIAVGRSLLYAWLGLAFGAPPGLPRTPLPERPYTRIEERFLLRAARDVAQQLASALRQRGPAEIDDLSIAEPEMLPGEGLDRHLVASFDVRGLEDLCRLRLALPAQAMELPGPALAAGRPHGPSPLEGPLLDTQVTVRVEAGVVSLPLGRVANLRVGDVLPLERTDPRGLLVRIEDEARFRAVRGAVGGRLAVQLVDRL